MIEVGIGGGSPLSPVDWTAPEPITNVSVQAISGSGSTQLAREVLDAVRRLYDAYGDWVKPSELLISLAKDGKSFADYTA